MTKHNLYQISNEELEQIIANFKGDRNAIASNGRTYGENYDKIVKHFNVNHILSYSFKKLICTLSTI